MSTDARVEELEEIRERHSLPTDVETHLTDIVEQFGDEATDAADANMLGTRVQKLVFYLTDEYRDEYDNMEAVRDELLDVYAAVVKHDL